MTKAQATAAIIAAVLLLTGGMLSRNIKADMRDYMVGSVVVGQGDTLWSIAGEYCPDDMDKRDYIEIIQRDNGCTADIRPGEVIVVRVYE